MVLIEAKKYLQNQIILENCKSYLEVLQLFPQYKSLMSLVDKFNLETMFTSQNFISTENKTNIIFKLHSYDDIRVDWLS